MSHLNLLSVFFTTSCKQVTPSQALLTCRRAFHALHFCNVVLGECVQRLDGGSQCRQGFGQVCFTLIFDGLHLGCLRSSNGLLLTHYLRATQDGTWQQETMLHGTSMCTRHQLVTEAVGTPQR